MTRYVPYRKLGAVAKMNWEAAKQRDRLERPGWDHDYARRSNRQAPVKRTRLKDDPHRAAPYTAQFPGICFYCHGHISPGDKITYFPHQPRNQRTCHQACEASKHRSSERPKGDRGGR